MSLFGFLVLIFVVLFVCFVNIILRVLRTQKLQHLSPVFLTCGLAIEKESISEKVDFSDIKPPVLTISKPPVSLRSSKGIDYSKLQNLLENFQWQKADEETRLILNKMGESSKLKYLDNEGISQIPCTDLKTIDSLWLHYSNCHFGLTVQHQLWQASKQDINLFGVWIGWYKQERVTIKKSDLIYDLSAPVGHLPVSYLPIVGDYLWIVLDSVAWLNKHFLYCQNES